MRIAGRVGISYGRGSSVNDSVLIDLQYPNTIHDLHFL